MFPIRTDKFHFKALFYFDSLQSLDFPVISHDTLHTDMLFCDLGTVRVTNVCCRNDTWLRRCSSTLEMLRRQRVLWDNAERERAWLQSRATGVCVPLLHRIGIRGDPCIGQRGWKDRSSKHKSHRQIQWSVGRLTGCYYLSEMLGEHVFLIRAILMRDVYSARHMTMRSLISRGCLENWSWLQRRRITLRVCGTSPGQK